MNRNDGRDKGVHALFFPLAPRSGERVADEVGGERGLSVKQGPLPPSLRSGTLSRKRERGKGTCALGRNYACAATASR